MFNSLKGIITSKDGDTVRLETGGVEWELLCPASDAERLPEPGQEARVFTWLYHREDAMRLFGFYDEKRRDTFLELLKVEGIGPGKAALILGRISQGELERALEAEDLERLEAVPGLGKKTAQKMILALKGRIVRPRKAGGAASAYGDLAEALSEMGYDRKSVSEALSQAAAELPPGLAGPDKEKFLFKQAILRLSA